MSNDKKNNTVILDGNKLMEYSAESKKLIFDNLKWMTTSEAATYLRKSANALRTAVCRGHIVARRFRRRLYFKRSDLDRLIETSTTIGGNYGH